VNRQYYYLISLLPTLVFGARTPLSSETFRQTCETHLNPKDDEILKKITTNENNNGQLNRFYDKWYRWDHTFKKELGALRAAKMSPGNESRSFQSPSDRDLRETIHQILSATHPLEAETLLEKARWKHLDEMELGIYFDFEKIISYALKLKIMERLESFDPVRGGIRFKETLDALCLTAAPEMSTG
jgi:hypothetical protein